MSNEEEKSYNHKKKEQFYISNIFYKVNENIRMELFLKCQHIGEKIKSCISYTY